MIVGRAKKKSTERASSEVTYRIAKGREIVKTYGGDMNADSGDYIIVGEMPYVYSSKTFEELFTVIEETTQKDEVYSSKTFEELFTVIEETTQKDEV